MSHRHNGRQLGHQTDSTVSDPARTAGGPANGRSRVRSATASAGHVRQPALPVSVVIPTWNEVANIGQVLALMPAVAELVIVDAYSDDGTVETVLQHRPDAVIVLQKPTGRGPALRAGFEVATADYIVSMKGDGSMDPGEIPGHVALLEQGYDVVKGSRGAVGGGSTNRTVLRRAGQWGLTGLYNTVFGTRLSDLGYGFIGFRRDKLAVLGLYAVGSEIEVQLIAHAQLAGLSLAELPSKETGPISGQNHLSSFEDGRDVLSAIVRARISPGREWWRHLGSPVPRYEVLDLCRPQEDRSTDVAEEPAPDVVTEAGRANRFVPVIPRQRLA